jgi:hypothetical protein
MMILAIIKLAAAELIPGMFLSGFEQPRPQCAVNFMRTTAHSVRKFAEIACRFLDHEGHEESQPRECDIGKPQTPPRDFDPGSLNVLSVKLV